MKIVRLLLPVLIVAAGVAGAGLLVKFGKKTTPEEIPFVPPLVEVVEAEPGGHQFHVSAQGSVSARTEIDLVAEVAGRIAWISPSLAAGGFFEKGGDLARIEARDFELAVTAAKAELTQARATLTREEAEAAVAIREWKELGQGDASPLLKREPQLAQARAAVEAAEAAVERGERDLARCVIRAPFAGRVERKGVDVGQYVSRGMSLGRLYSIDVAEVRLPIPAEELAYLDLPLGFRDGDASRPGPAVALRAEFAGKVHEWRGRITRTEGRIDTRSRMVYAVAEVDDPYGRATENGNPPLAVGLYVDCEIAGRTVKDASILPRRALRNTDELWVVGPDDRLEVRRVEVLRAGRETVVVGSGVKEGERVCVSSLDAVVNGMRVRVSEEEDQDDQKREKPGAAR